MTRPNYQHALANISASTVDSIDNALLQTIRLSGKYMRGEDMTDAEAATYLEASRLLKTFSGEVIVSALQVLIQHPRGQRVLAGALPTVFAVAVHPPAGPMVQDFERDAEGELMRVVSRPMAPMG